MEKAIGLILLLLFISSTAFAQLESLDAKPITPAAKALSDAAVAAKSIQIPPTDKIRIKFFVVDVIEQKIRVTYQIGTVDGDGDFIVSDQKEVYFSDETGTDFDTLYAAMKIDIQAVKTAVLNKI